ncbi:hypothetical protein [Nocardioides terrisoli]|uniref:hypothetical protein n=1 Tax=Nocardioides terrisoli TaxID=3388267 RepID=UPI00287B733F|nr:hypothetical protein [Nocardioides marmorisolisilvae]
MAQSEYISRGRLRDLTAVIGEVGAKQFERMVMCGVLGVLLVVVGAAFVGVGLAIGDGLVWGAGVVVTVAACGLYFAPYSGVTRT